MRPAMVLLRRSAWKGPNIVPLPISRAKSQGIPIQTVARSCTVLPSFVGLTFQVHNGKEYFSFRITEEMVGFKLGEFVPTRKRFSFKSQNK
ncbi:hypothetical protein V1525DRAFT_344679 [Lipomyces kononenkoae]|uniref:Uncharacterized protein n=1 Tax=Lipomyces kononenkoae TaxID=34357 RepID=A0ACC3SZK3_LIPKO